MPNPVAYFAILVSALVLGCTPSEDGAADADRLAGAAAFVRDYVAAVDSRDAESLTEMFVDDGRFVWIEDGAVRYRSADEIVVSLGQFPADMSLHTEIRGLTVEPVGQTGAHAWGDFTTSVGSGPEGFSFSGAISFVLDRADGSWRLVGGHTSTSSGGG